MFIYLKQKEKNLPYRCVSALIVLVLSVSLVISPTASYAQAIIPQTVLNLPIPGAMVMPTAGFTPAIVRGITVYPENPLRFDFIVDPGDDHLQGEDLRRESSKLIKYFLASLTVPEEEIWVNLSPYEKDRIIPKSFGNTEMGRDLLAQDYLLKQLSASLMYPEDELGKKFWDRVYKRAYEEFGTTEIPMNTFNKIWIVPQKATVYEKDQSAYVLDSHLKVMLEEDYLALQENRENKKFGMNGLVEEDVNVISGVLSEVVREVLIPEIEREVNEGQTFANLRQIFNSMILATWYKVKLKDSLLGQVYVDKNKTKGVETLDKEVNQKIYEQYTEAFSKGVYNYIREDYDPMTQEVIPRKYFSGGISVSPLFADGIKEMIEEGIVRDLSREEADALIDRPGYKKVTWDAQVWKKELSDEIAKHPGQLFRLPGQEVVEAPVGEQQAENEVVIVSSPVIFEELIEQAKQDIYKAARAKEEDSDSHIAELEEGARLLAGFTRLTGASNSVIIQMALDYLDTFETLPHPDENKIIGYTLDKRNEILKKYNDKNRKIIESIKLDIARSLAFLGKSVVNEFRRKRNSMATDRLPGMISSYKDYLTVQYISKLAEAVEPDGADEELITNSMVIEQIGRVMDLYYQGDASGGAEESIEKERNPIVEKRGQLLLVRYDIKQLEKPLLRKPVFRPDEFIDAVRATELAKYFSTNVFNKEENLSKRIEILKHLSELAQRVHRNVIQPASKNIVNTKRGLFNKFSFKKFVVEEFKDSLRPGDIVVFARRDGEANAEEYGAFIVRGEKLSLENVTYAFRVPAVSPLADREIASSPIKEEDQDLSATERANKELIDRAKKLGLKKKVVADPNKGSKKDKGKSGTSSPVKYDEAFQARLFPRNQNVIDDIHSQVGFRKGGERAKEILRNWEGGAYTTKGYYAVAKNHASNVIAGKTFVYLIENKLVIDFGAEKGTQIISVKGEDPLFVDKQIAPDEQSSSPVANDDETRASGIIKVGRFAFSSRMALETAEAMLKHLNGDFTKGVKVPTARFNVYDRTHEEYPFVIVLSELERENRGEDSISIDRSPLVIAREFFNEFNESRKGGLSEIYISGKNAVILDDVMENTEDLEIFGIQYAYPDANGTRSRVGDLRDKARNNKLMLRKLANDYAKWLEKRVGGIKNEVASSGILSRIDEALEKRSEQKRQRINLAEKAITAELEKGKLEYTVVDDRAFTSIAHRGDGFLRKIQIEGEKEPLIIFERLGNLVVQFGQVIEPAVFEAAADVEDRSTLQLSGEPLFKSRAKNIIANVGGIKSAITRYLRRRELSVPEYRQGQVYNFSNRSLYGSYLDGYSLEIVGVDTAAGEYTIKTSRNDGDHQINKEGVVSVEWFDPRMRQVLSPANDIMKKVGRIAIIGERDSAMEIELHSFKVHFGYIEDALQETSIVSAENAASSPVKIEVQSGIEKFVSDWKRIETHPRVIISDLEGTLLKKQKKLEKLQPEMRDGIEQFLRSGGYFILVTGRLFTINDDTGADTVFLEQFPKDIRHRILVMTGNGGERRAFVNSGKGLGDVKSLIRKEFSPEQVEAIMQQFKIVKEQLGLPDEAKIDDDVGGLGQPTRLRLLVKGKKVDGFEDLTLRSQELFEKLFNDSDSTKDIIVRALPRYGVLQMSFANKFTAARDGLSWLEKVTGNRILPEHISVWDDEYTNDNTQGTGMARSAGPGALILNFGKDIKIPELDVLHHVGQNENGAMQVLTLMNNNIADQSSSPLNSQDIEVLTVMFAIHLKDFVEQAKAKGDRDEMRNVVREGIAEIFGFKQNMTLENHLVESLMDDKSIQEALASYNASDTSSSPVEYEEALEMARNALDLAPHPDNLTLEVALKVLEPFTQGEEGPVPVSVWFTVAKYANKVDLELLENIIHHVSVGKVEALDFDNPIAAPLQIAENLIRDAITKKRQASSLAQREVIVANVINAVARYFTISPDLLDEETTLKELGVVNAGDRMGFGIMLAGTQAPLGDVPMHWNFLDEEVKGMLNLADIVNSVIRKKELDQTTSSPVGAKPDMLAIKMLSLFLEGAAKNSDLVLNVDKKSVSTSDGKLVDWHKNYAPTIRGVSKTIKANKDYDSEILIRQGSSEKKVRALLSNAAKIDETTVSSPAKKQESSSPVKVLVVEDSPSVRQILVYYFENEGYDVIGAKSGEDALEKLAENPDIQFVNTVFKMPGMNGIQLIRQAKKEFPNIKGTTVLTSDRNQKEIREALEEGLIDNVFQKPHGLKEMVEAVKAKVPTSNLEGDEGSASSPESSSPARSDKSIRPVRIVKTDINYNRPSTKIHFSDNSHLFVLWMQNEVEKQDRTLFMFTPHTGKTRTLYESGNQVYKMTPAKILEIIRKFSKKHLDDANLAMLYAGISSSPIMNMSNQKEVGGIDLNSALLDLQIKRDGNGVPLPLPQQPIHQMNIQGFIPVIINVTPVNLPMILGLVDEDSPVDSADADSGMPTMDLGFADKWREKYIHRFENINT